MAESILRAAGRQTGLYTSPHLLDVAERVRLDGAPVSHATLAGHAAPILPDLRAGRVSFFEAMTAVALAAFRDAGVDVAVLEVGLGGRWDATTVGRPLVSAITRIDHDHQEYLGHRLVEIAGEKAAIIRGGVAVSAAQAPEALTVVETRCRTLGVPLLVEGREIRVAVRRSDLDGHRLDITGPDWEIRDAHLPLLGLFQPGNAAVAVAAAHALARAAGWTLHEAAVREGLAGVRWPGRFQVLAAPTGRPAVVLDGAHNPAGAAALATSLRHYFPRSRITLVLGVSADKDRAGILKALAPLATRVILTAAAHPRAAPPAELAGELPPAGGEVRVAASVADALAIALADPDADVVCVAGSLFLVADALTWLQRHGLAGA
jgi:dihydrofolate synthase/folylpolyglutamate synthase